MVNGDKEYYNHENNTLVLICESYKELTSVFLL